MVSLSEAAIGGWYVPLYAPFVLFFLSFYAFVVVYGGLYLVLIVGGERKIRCKCERPRKKKESSFPSPFFPLLDFRFS